jgi:enoyl-CoA hydratase/carnithine racemase
VTCTSDATLGLPELALGLIPGAGGTVSITRRIGRWRTAYLVLSGQTIDAATALGWGLVDEVTQPQPTCPTDAGSP